MSHEEFARCARYGNVAPEGNGNVVPEGNGNVRDRVAATDIFWRVKGSGRRFPSILQRVARFSSHEHRPKKKPLKRTRESREYFVPFSVRSRKIVNDRRR